MFHLQLFSLWFIRNTLFWQRSHCDDETNILQENDSSQNGMIFCISAAWLSGLCVLDWFCVFLKPLRAVWRSHYGCCVLFTRRQRLESISESFVHLLRVWLLQSLNKTQIWESEKHWHSARFRSIHLFRHAEETLLTGSESVRHSLTFLEISQCKRRGQWDLGQKCCSVDGLYSPVVERLTHQESDASVQIHKRTDSEQRDKDTHRRIDARLTFNFLVQIIRFYTYSR